MNCHHLKLIIFLWKLVNLSGIVSEKTCALNDLFACPEGESCKQIRNSSTLGICECKNKFKRIYPNSGCVEQTESINSPLPNPESVYSPEVSVSVIAGVLAIVLLVVIIGAALIYAAKKYRWLHRVREKAQQYRASHYDTVLINQEDDPPLT